MKTNQSIFFSWQSDSPRETNQNGIRHSLRDASSIIETTFPQIKIDIEEATSNTTGSPNIPNKLFEKISIADIYVCDLTTINSETTEDKRKVANPNVLIEFGFAIANLGWDRIIILFNTNIGAFPKDLPFNIDRHRAIPYCIKDKTDKNGKVQLTKSLTVAIESIIKAAPLKPIEKQIETPEQKKRRIDITNLTWLLNSLHIGTFDYFLENMPTTIIGKILFYQEGFYSIINSNSFHIYDQQLLQLLLNFNSNWNKSLSYTEYYNPVSGGKNYRYYIPADVFPNAKSAEDFKILTKICIELKENFISLLSFIRQNYLEIDIEETNRNAFDNYKKHIEDE